MPGNIRTFFAKKKPAIKRRWEYLVRICAIFLAIFTVFLFCATFFLAEESLTAIIILWNIITIIAGVILLALYFTNPADKKEKQPWQ